jgi:pimeloyl-ACP methyl ester carboxylesterase
VSPGSSTRSAARPLGRTVVFDAVGDPGDVPVVYLHGTPDSRRSRHPDDSLAAEAGVLLLAVDRPGYGGTSPLPGGPGDPTWSDVVAGDVAAVLDAAGADRAAVLAWSGGALAGLALAAASGGGGCGTLAAPLADRVAALGIVSGLVPRDAYDDPAVRAAGEARLGVIELADILPPGVLGAEVAPMLAPHPCDAALAAEHQAEHRSAGDAAELGTVAGGVDVMADGLVGAVAHGLAGVEADLEAQARPLAVDLGALVGPVRLWYGEADEVTPVAFGRWYEEHLPEATLAVVPGAGHYVALTRWADLLGDLAALVPPA